MYCAGQGHVLWGPVGGRGRGFDCYVGVGCARGKELDLDLERPPKGSSMVSLVTLHMRAMHFPWTDGEGSGFGAPPVCPGQGGCRRSSSKEPQPLSQHGQGCLNNTGCRLIDGTNRSFAWPTGCSGGAGSRGGGGGTVLGGARAALWGRGNGGRQGLWKELEREGGRSVLQGAGEGGKTRMADWMLRGGQAAGAGGQEVLHCGGQGGRGTGRTVGGTGTQYPTTQ